MRERDVIVLLTEWGKWNRGGVGGRCAVTGVWDDDLSVGVISDERAAKIDVAVCALGRESARLKNIVMQVYVYDREKTQVCARLTMTRYEFDVSLALAHEFVGCYLYPLKKIA